MKLSAYLLSLKLPHPITVAWVLLYLLVASGRQMGRMFCVNCTGLSNERTAMSLY